MKKWEKKCKEKAKKAKYKNKDKFAPIATLVDTPARKAQAPYFFAMVEAIADMAPFAESSIAAALTWYMIKILGKESVFDVRWDLMHRTTSDGLNPYLMYFLYVVYEDFFEYKLECDDYSRNEAIKDILNIWLDDMLSSEEGVA